MKTRNWNSKNILITGGSSGLGRALALQLIDRGANVAVVARGAEALEQLQQISPRLQIICGDVSNKKDIHRIYNEARQKTGEIDVLVNNASTLGPVPLRLLIDTDCEDFSAALETNLLAPFRLSKLVLPSMILRGQGIIVNISSDAAIQNYPSWGAYSVSKSALDHLTRVFEAELQETGVMFAAVDPGDMNTSLHLTAIPNADTAKLKRPEQSAAQLIEWLERGQISAAHRGLQ